MADKKDLTRIEDLSDFFHDDDPETDALLENSASDNPLSSESEISDLEDNSDKDSDEGIFNDETSDETSKEDHPEECSFEQNEETQDQGLENSDSSDDFEAIDADDLTDNEIETSYDFSSDDNEGEEDEQFKTDFPDGDNDENFFESVDNDETQDHNDFLEETPEIENHLLDESEVPQELSPISEDETEDEDEIEDQEDEEDEVQDEIQEEFEEEIGEDFPKEVYIEAPSPEEVPSKSLHSRTSTSTHDFKDLSHFAEKMIYGSIVSEGSPAFSIKVTNIRYKEDADDILIILREHGFITQQNEKVFTDGLNSGAILIAHISEYAAIYLCHRFRRFDLSIEMGPAESIHKSKSYTLDNFVPISKREIYQNTTSSKSSGQKVDGNKEIISSVAAEVENFQIIEHLGPAHCFELVDSGVITNKDNDKIQRVHETLLNDLKKIAISRAGDAITYLNYSLSPITIENEEKYQITCSGNIVKIKKSSKGI